MLVRLRAPAGGLHLKPSSVLGSPVREPPHSKATPQQSREGKCCFPPEPDGARLCLFLESSPFWVIPSLAQVN